jgi:hypothetical protein
LIFIEKFKKINFNKTACNNINRVTKNFQLSAAMASTSEKSNPRTLTLEPKDNMECETSTTIKRKNPQREASKGLFQNPHKRHTAKAPETFESESIDLTNIFEPLSDASSESSEAPDPKKKKVKHSPKAAKAASLQPTTKNKKTMPIHIPSTSCNEIQNIVQSLKLSSYTISKVKAKQYKIVTTAIEDKKMIIEELNKKNIGNFTHSERQDRRVIFVLKNHHEPKAEDVLQELKALNIPAITVSKIGNSDEDPIHAVSFEKNSITLDTLRREFSVLNNLKVQWVKYQPRTKRYIQCSNCQRWGHGKANCNLPRRCVKCREEHPEKECSRKSKTAPGEPACVNCGKEGHPANAKICEAYIKHVEVIEKRKRVTASQQPRRFTSTPAPWAPQSNTQLFPPLSNYSNPGTNQSPAVVPNREYRPFLTQPRENTHSQNTEFNIFDIKNELMSIPGMVETMKLYRELVQKLRQAPTPQQKLAILLSYGLSCE